MYTPSDSQWIRENREREVYQASEARWSVEGAVVPAPERPGFPMWLLKRIFQRQPKSEAAQKPLENVPSSWKQA